MDIEKIRTNFQEINRPVWTGVPVISFAGVIIGVGFASLAIGSVACGIASVFLAIIAYLKPRRDIVALLAPMYALLIFNPYSSVPNSLTLQVLFAATITVAAIRMEKRFSSI